eukprot:7386474-Prymnesium_polylepis.2
MHAVSESCPLLAELNLSGCRMGLCVRRPYATYPACSSRQLGETCVAVRCSLEGEGTICPPHQGQDTERGGGVVVESCDHVITHVSLTRLAAPIHAYTE